MIVTHNLKSNVDTTLHESLAPPAFTRNAGRASARPADEQVEENPFGAVAVEVEPDNPFELAADIHDPAAERGELEALLDGATAVVGALEAALERARQQERALRERLARG